MEDTAVRTAVEDYLKAFAARDVDRCLEHFAPEAKIEWMMGVYRGIAAIREWHQDRFAADLKILEVEKMDFSDSEAVIDVVVHSKRLAAWRLPSLTGRVTVRFDDNGKIAVSKYAAKSINPQQNWS